MGRLRLESPSTNDAALVFDGGLSGAMPTPPVSNSAEEAQAYINTPEYRALARGVKHYTVEMKSGPSFTVENVAPGTYWLFVQARLGGERAGQHPPVAQGNIQVTVPDSFSPSTPIDIGEIVLHPIPQQ